MDVTQIVQLEGGKSITMVVNDREHREIFSAGVNYLLRKGWLVVSSNEDIVGTEEAIKEVESAVKQSDEATKQ